MAAARGGPGEAAGGEALGDTRSLGGGGAPPCAWGGASAQTGQLSKGSPLGQLRFSQGAAGTRGRGGSGARGAAGKDLGVRGLPPGRGSGHVSRGASEQRAWGRAPGIVGDQARDGSRGEPDSGWAGAGGGGARRPAGKREEGSAPLSRGRSAGPGTPEEEASGGMTLGAGQAEKGVSLRTPRSPHPRAAAGRAGSGLVSLPLRLLLATAEGGKMAPAPASPLKGPETPAGKSHRTGPAPHGQPIITSTNSNPPLHYRHPPP